MTLDAKDWSVVENIHEYEINRELEIKIKNFLVKNHHGFDNSTLLMQECFDEFDIEYEENHPIEEWSMDVWRANYGES